MTAILLGIAIHQLPWRKYHADQSPDAIKPRCKCHWPEGLRHAPLVSAFQAEIPWVADSQGVALIVLHKSATCFVARCCGNVSVRVETLTSAGEALFSRPSGGVVSPICEMCRTMRALPWAEISQPFRLKTVSRERG